MSTETQGYHVFGVECKNCRWRTGDLPRGEYFTIPRGTPISEAKCPLCGCQTLGAGFMGNVSASPAESSS